MYDTDCTMFAYSPKNFRFSLFLFRSSHYITHFSNGRWSIHTWLIQLSVSRLMNDTVAMVTQFSLPTHTQNALDNDLASW